MTQQPSPSRPPASECPSHGPYKCSPSSLLKMACCQAQPRFPGTVLLPRLATSAYHILDDFILPILPLNFEQVVTEVKQVESPLLAQQDNDGATSPVQAVTKTLPGVGKEAAGVRGSSWRESKDLHRSLCYTCWAGVSAGRDPSSAKGARGCSG